jgi:hypothetical protein
MTLRARPQSTFPTSTDTEYVNVRSSERTDTGRQAFADSARLVAEGGSRSTVQADTRTSAPRAGIRERFISRLEACSRSERRHLLPNC